MQKNIFCLFVLHVTNLVALLFFVQQKCLNVYAQFKMRL